MTDQGWEPWFPDATHILQQLLWQQHRGTANSYTQPIQNSGIGTQLPMPHVISSHIGFLVVLGPPGGVFSCYHGQIDRLGHEGQCQVGFCKVLTRTITVPCGIICFQLILHAQQKCCSCFQLTYGFLQLMVRDSYSQTIHQKQAQAVFAKNWSPSRGRGDLPRHRQGLGGCSGPIDWKGDNSQNTSRSCIGPC